MICEPTYIYKVAEFMSEKDGEPEVRPEIWGDFETAKDDAWSRLQVSKVFRQAPLVQAGIWEQIDF